jgi:hypothetical protein
VSDSTDDQLTAEPFPPLTWDEFCWTGSITLASWSGFQSRLGPYGAINSARASDGTARLYVAVPGDNQVAPSPEQAEAVRHLLAHQSTVRDTVLAAILREYPAMRESYGYDDDEADELMPEVSEAGHLRDLLGLSNIHVLTVAKEGTAYIGFEFGCTWDTEHGLGVMTHRGRVVEVGGADTSFLVWIAERDAESRG